MKTPFDNMFDYNRDGKLSWPEQGARDAFVLHIMQQTEQKETLRDHCIDADEVSDMDEDERAETLSDAGLDPDDFEF